MYGLKSQSYPGYTLRWKTGVRMYHSHEMKRVVISLTSGARLYGSPSPPLRS
jgi:hypothetical protein